MLIFDGLIKLLETITEYAEKELYDIGTLKNKTDGTSFAI